MRIHARKNFLYCIAISAVLFGVLFWGTEERKGTLPVFFSERFQEETVIIDAGHGGEDGGAVSYSGVPESGINLSIALKLDQLFGFYGVNSILLRTEDISLHDNNAETLRQKKASDLRNRVALVESVANGTLISIHQNACLNAKYHGAQVFYANEGLSLPLATRTQDVMREVLDPANQRTPAKVPEHVYLMKHVTCRAILVECGFLSNPEEDLRLQNSGYQLKIAGALVGAYLTSNP